MKRHVINAPKDLSGIPTRTEYPEPDQSPMSDKLRDMLQSRRAPGTIGCESNLMANRMNNEELQTMNPVMRKHLLDKAAAAGVSVRGKTYNASIAEFSGDPSAWVSDTNELIKKANAVGRDVTIGDKTYQASAPQAFTAEMKRKQAIARARAATEAKEKKELIVNA